MGTHGPRDKSPPLAALRTFIAEKVHGVSDTLDYNKIQWKAVKLSVNWAGNPETHFVSLGSSKERERLFIDENTPHIKALKDRVKARCQGGKSVQDVLSVVNEEINALTLIPGMSDSDVERTLNKRLESFLFIQPKDKEKNINLNLDTLIDQKLLVCRHKAILAASILGTLVDEKILPNGKARQFRANLLEGKSDIAMGAHTWAVYRDSKTSDLWVCDPRWRTAKKVTLPQFAGLREYGLTTLQEMVLRTDLEDKIERKVSQEEIEKTLENIKRALQICNDPEQNVQRMKKQEEVANEMVNWIVNGMKDSTSWLKANQEIVDEWIESSYIQFPLKQQLVQIVKPEQYYERGYVPHDPLVKMVWDKIMEEEKKEETFFKKSGLPGGHERPFQVNQLLSMLEKIERQEKTPKLKAKALENLLLVYKGVQYKESVIQRYILVVEKDKQFNAQLEAVKTAKEWAKGLPSKPGEPQLADEKIELQQYAERKALANVSPSQILAIASLDVMGVTKGVFRHYDIEGGRKGFYLEFKTKKDADDALNNIKTKFGENAARISGSTRGEAFAGGVVKIESEDCLKLMSDALLPYTDAESQTMHKAFLNALVQLELKMHPALLAKSFDEIKNDFAKIISPPSSPTAPLRQLVRQQRTTDLKDKLQLSPQERLTMEEKLYELSEAFKTFNEMQPREKSTQMGIVFIKTEIEALKAKGQALNPLEKNLETLLGDYKVQLLSANPQLNTFLKDEKQVAEVQAQITQKLQTVRRPRRGSPSQPG